MRRYAAGERDAAVAAVAALSPGRLRRELAALTAQAAKAARSCATTCDALVAWREARPQAAAMLHTDAFLEARNRAPAAARPQGTAAAAVVELLQGEPEQRGFVERWYAAMTGVAVRDNRWAEAQAWAERGLGALPGSADLQLALGAVLESRRVRSRRRAGRGCWAPRSSSARPTRHAPRGARAARARAARARRGARRRALARRGAPAARARAVADRRRGRGARGARAGAVPHRGARQRLPGARLRGPDRRGRRRLRGGGALLRGRHRARRLRPGAR